jgi:hypothetical protein
MAWSEQMILCFEKRLGQGVKALMRLGFLLVL